MCPGRLPAVLLAWLLALANGAASNAASNEAGAVALSRLMSSRGRHHHHHLITAQAAPKLTQAQEFVKADEEAADDFVRRCQVVVTVSDHKFLPIAPLDRFCRTTDAVVDCRLKVGQRLKETHARDGDMGKFCSAVYDWFQGKYGMKCPSQCRKLQCKSSCMWLDAKKKLNKDDLLIKDEMLKAEDALKVIKAMGQKVHENLSSEKKLKFALKMLNVKLGRAKKSLAENKADQNATSIKVKKVNTAYTKLENTIEATKQSLIKQADAIMKAKFAIDKAKLKHENMMRSIQRDTDRGKEDREEQKSLQGEADKLNVSIVELSQQKASLTKTVAADTKAASAQAKALATKVDAMIKAAKELDAFKVVSVLVQEDAAPTSPKPSYEAEYGKYMSGNYKKDPSVPIIKELVENQHKRVKAAEKLLHALQKKIRDTEDEIKEVEHDKTRLEKEKKKADDASATADKKADDLEKKASTSSASATKFLNSSITMPEVELQKQKDKETKTQVSKAKAERTLKHMGQLVQEQQAKLNSDNGAVTSSEDAQKSVEDQITESTGALTNMQKQVSDSQAEEKAAKEKLATEEKGLVARIKVYKVAAKDLDKHKPEIVRQHGLQPEL